MLKNKMYYKFLLIKAFLTTDLITGIRVVYMLSYSISEGEITVLKGLFTLIIALAEIPTGIISDKISRKLSLQIGAILFAGHALFYVATPSFIGFFLTQFFLALSAAFISGADVGYYDDYIKQYTNDKYIEIVGKIDYIVSFISAFFYMISGFLFNYFPQMNFLITSVLGLLSFGIISSFPNFKIQENKFESSKKFIEKYVKDVRDVLFFYIKNRNIVRITLITTIIIGLLIFNFEYYQILLVEFSFPNKYLGVLYASFMILSGIGERISVFLVKKLKIDFIAIAFMFLLAVSYLIFAISNTLVMILAGVIIQQICFGSWSLIAQNEVLEHIPSEETKSTMMSMNNLIVSFARSIIVFILGGILSFKGYVITYVAMIGIMIIAVSLLLKLDKKK